MKPGIETIEDARAYLLAELDKGWEPTAMQLRDDCGGYCALGALITDEEAERFYEYRSWPAGLGLDPAGNFARWLYVLMQANDGDLREGHEFSGDTPAERVRKFLEKADG